jgi:hypothetical protein
MSFKRLNAVDSLRQLQVLVRFEQDSPLKTGSFGQKAVKKRPTEVVW